MEREQIGLIGVGLLGTAIAERLLQASFSVLGFDIDLSRLSGLETLGGVSARSAEEIAQTCPRMILCLPNSDIVNKVAESIEPHLRPSQLLMDTTTGDPTHAESLGRRLLTHKVDYVDATVAGSSEQARRGDVIVMAGGAPHAVANCRDLCATFSRHSYHVGGCGSGARMKLVVNLVLGLNRAALAEGLAFARASGIDPHDALAILKDSAAHSQIMDTKGEKMANRQFDPQARLAQHLKDVRLILKQGEANGAWLPLSCQHQNLLELSIELGHGEADNSAVIEAYYCKETPK